MNSLSSLSETTNNNFQLIRLLAALGVFLSHTFPVGGFGLGGKAQLLGHLSLNTFFLISGFLVCKSFMARPLKAYFVSRILRIFPALVFVVLASVFILGLSVTELSMREYLTNPDVYEYTIKNILLLLPDTPLSLPGVFLESKYASTVNAPLWSLPYELSCYLLLAIFAVATRAKHKAQVLTVISVLLFVLCFSVYMANSITKSVEFAFYFGKDTYRLLGMFFLGVSFYLLGSKVQVTHKLMCGFILLVGLSVLYRPAFIVLFYLFLAYATFYFSYAIKGPLLRFNALGDYSYGIYIIGYPVQQTIEQLLPDLSLPLYFVITLTITLTLSVLSWHLIEKRALSLKATRV